VLSAGAGISRLERAPAVTAADVGTLPAAGSPAPTAPGPSGSARAGSTPSGTATAPVPPSRRKPAARPAVVPPGVPAQLALPAQRTTAPVVATEVDADGELDIPAAPATVGWWAGSAPAGTAGPTVLAGHVDSASRGVGALAALRDVRVGDPVVLTDTAGGRHGYVVTARRTYAKYALPREAFTAAPLVLITCGGPFDRDRGHYRDNIVVYARAG
jgi:Sortase domain